jgi:transposase
METRSQKHSQEQKQTPENFIKDIRRKARRIFSSEQKILIVIEALRGEDSVAAICRKYGIVESVFYKWNKEFLEAGKKPLAGDTTHEATSGEVTALRKDNQKLKEVMAELVVRYDIVKKALNIWDSRKVEEVYATDSI